MTRTNDLAMAEQYQAEAERYEADIRETENQLPHYSPESRKSIDWLLGEKRTILRALLNVADWHRERAKREE